MVGERGRARERERGRQTVDDIVGQTHGRTSWQTACAVDLPTRTLHDIDTANLLLPIYMRYSAGIKISELLSVCLDRLIFCKYIMKHIILTLLCYYIIYNVTSLYMFLGFTISIKMFHHVTSIFIFHQYVSLFHARVHPSPMCFTIPLPTILSKKHHEHPLLYSRIMIVNICSIVAATIIIVSSRN